MFRGFRVIIEADMAKAIGEYWKLPVENVLRGTIQRSKPNLRIWNG